MSDRTCTEQPYLWLEECLEFRSQAAVRNSRIEGVPDLSPGPSLRQTISSATF